MLFFYLVKRLLFAAYCGYHSVAFEVGGVYFRRSLLYPVALVPLGLFALCLPGVGFGLYFGTSSVGLGIQNFIDY